MQPQESKQSLVNIAALTGAGGLGSIILFFAALFYGISDGSLNFLLLLGIGIVLSFVGCITGFLALRRHTPSKSKAIVGIITGLVGVSVLLFVFIYAAMWANGFSAGY